MRRRRPGFTMIELLAVILLISTLIALLLPAVQSSREAARRSQCANNLRQLGLATTSYESTFRVLPPGTVDRTGPVIESSLAYQYSWIAQLLPQLEKGNVFRNLNFDRGVYADANLSARTVTMRVLLCPSRSLGGAAYAACHHDVEAPIDSTNRGVFFLNSRVRSAEIEDGLSHTIFFGEKTPGGDELGWASGSRATLRNSGTAINRTFLDASGFDLALAPFGPPDLGVVPIPIEDRGPPPEPIVARPNRVGGFGSHHPGGANFALGDGSVRFLASGIDRRIYRLLASRDDGEPIGDDQF